jgi:hypothetical protein
MIALPLLLGYLAVPIILVAWPVHSGLITWIEVPLLLVALLFMALAVWIVVSPIRRWLKTGRLLLSPSEVTQKRRDAWSKLGAGKPVGPQLWLWLLPALCSLMFLWIGAVAIAAGSCGCGPTR